MNLNDKTWVLIFLYYYDLLFCSNPNNKTWRNVQVDVILIDNKKIKILLTVTFLFAVFLLQNAENCAGAEFAELKGQKRHKPMPEIYGDFEK